MSDIGAAPRKFSVSLVKRQESFLLTDDECSPPAGAAAVWQPRLHRQQREIILRLSWKLRVHGYLAKFVAACGAISLALEALAGFLTPVTPGRDPVAAALRSGRFGEWIGFACVCVGLTNLWVKSRRVSLLVAYAGNLLGIGLSGLGASVSCLLLVLYFRLRDAAATQDLLNASLLALFVLLAQLSALTALFAHTLAYHPYRIFASANQTFEFQCLAPRSVGSTAAPGTAATAIVEASPDASVASASGEQPDSVPETSINVIP